jgi:transcriptional regulator with PAS, ATPase and Fis domain
MKLENIMQPITTYFQMNNTLQEVTESMLKTKHNTVPVINEEGNLLGVFTRSSLYRMILDGASLETQIGSYIIQEATVTPYDITLEQLQERLQISKVGETVILNHEGKIAGLLTKQSVVRALIELTNSLKNQASYPNMPSKQSVLSNDQVHFSSPNKKTCIELSKALYTWNDIITRDPRMEETIQKVKRVARVRSSVLIRGESGTGKELFAHAIHSSSNRSHGPFVTINCAAVPEQLLEAEFFGYEGGAFTGAERKGQMGKLELAHGGTLFLDEIGDMPLNLQAKLLRALEGRGFYRLGGNKLIDVDVRIISATNIPLEQKIIEKKFREDLVYRLNIMSFHIPPLRERKNDILLLARSFINQLNVVLETTITGIDEEVQQVLYAHQWPGNIRELRNVLERGMVLSGQGKITASSLPEYLIQDKPYQGAPVTEQAEIEAALLETNGNKAKAARLLGMSRSTFYEKLNRLHTS